MKLTLKELFDNIQYETGEHFDEKKFKKMFDNEKNKEAILIYNSDEQINFIEKFLE